MERLVSERNPFLNVSANPLNPEIRLRNPDFGWREETDHEILRVSDSARFFFALL